MEKPTTIREGLIQLVLNLLDFINRLTSRRFLGVILSIVIPVLNSSLKWGVSDGVLTLITGAIVTYIVADTYEQNNQGIG